MATIKDIARESGFSVGTVSAVLNNSNMVSDETREKVLSVIEQLNYTPNRVARNLRKNETKTIGVIVPDITNPFFSQIIRSIFNIAYKNDYLLMQLDSNESQRIGEDEVKALINQRVDGIILIGDIVSEKFLANELQSKNIPFVVIERDYTNFDGPTFLVDTVKGGYLATKHLLDFGYKTVGVISGPIEQKSFYSSLGRLEGYRRALNDYGLPFDEQLIQQSDFTFDGGYQAMMKFISTDRIPRAVFAFNDLMALGAVEAIKNSGLLVPQDVAIVGYDDIPEAAYSFPALSTIRLPKKRLGEKAITELLDILKGQPIERKKIILDVDLVVRGSSGIFNSN